MHLHRTTSYSAQDVLNLLYMIATLWIVSSVILSGAVVMVRELLKAPEGVEDQYGFRVIRDARASKQLRTVALASNHGAKGIGAAAAARA